MRTTSAPSRTSPRPHRPGVSPGVLRSVVLALALAGLVIGALMALRPPPTGVPALVAARALEPGRALTPGDTHVVAVPPEALPEDALDVDGELPATWDGPAITTGTVLTESNVAGSPLSRALGPDQAQITVSVPATQVDGVVAGDLVEVWASPDACADRSCAAALLADGVRIASVSVAEDSPWESSSGAHVGLVLQASDTDRVLGHAGSGSLSLVLRPLGATDVESRPHRTGAPP